MPERLVNAERRLWRGMPVHVPRVDILVNPHVAECAKFELVIDFRYAQNNAGCDRWEDGRRGEAIGVKSVGGDYCGVRRHELAIVAT